MICLKEHSENKILMQSGLFENEIFSGLLQSSVQQRDSELKLLRVIPGNDQNTIPTNQGATGSKLDRAS